MLGLHAVRQVTPRLVAVVAIAALLVAVGVFLGLAPYDLQIYALLLVVTAAAALYLIPRAVKQDRSVSVVLLVAALAAKTLGTFVRYILLHAYFGGGDAVLYHDLGVANYQSVRSFDFSFVEPPYFGTPFMEDTVPFVYAVTGPSMLGGFHVFSMLAFVGTWFFYRAHRIGFPDGDARPFFFLMFFLPTMIFWPSSIGKDALIVFGLGVATHGLARLLQGVSMRSFVQLALGTVLTFGLRPAVAVMFLFGAGVAFLIHPGRVRSPLTRPTTAVLLGPVLLVGLVFSLQRALEYEQLGASPQDVVEEYVATQDRLVEEGGSVIEGPPVGTPAGLAQGILTVLFRPFPWELGTPLAGLAGLESLVILYVVVSRLPRGLRAFRLWRGGLIIADVIVTVSLLVPLAAFANFGLLTRQRAQLLPFLFMILTAVRKAPRARQVARPVRPGGVQFRAQAPATSG